MPLSFKIIASPSGEAISDWILHLPEDGGSIGRSYAATAQLADATRKISGIHAVIERGERGYRILDNSTNGLFVNGANKPLGKGQQTTLNDGDILDIGDYRLMCTCFVPQHAQERAPVLEAPANDPFSQQDFDDLTQNPAEHTANSRSWEKIHEQPAPPTIDPDPFHDGEDHERLPQQKAAFDLFDTNEFDDDPFSPGFSPRFRANGNGAASPNGHAGKTSDPSHSPIQAEPPLVQNPGANIGQFIQWQHKQQRIFEKAADMAITRLLNDMDPDAIESLFDDLAKPGIFRSKNHWRTYKSYYQRQMDTNDWVMKFRAYLIECNRLVQQQENR